MNNIRLLQSMGLKVDVACNFQVGNTTSDERVNTFMKELNQLSIDTYDITFPREVSNIKNMYRSYKLVKRLVAENRYEIIHCHSPIGGVIARLAAKNARKNYGTKVIYTAHGFHFYRGAPLKNWLLFYPIEKLISHHTDYLITINKEDYKMAITKKFAANKIVYMPGIGINTEEMSLPYVDKLRKMEEFGVKDEKILLSVGELNKNKNHEIIIKAISNIKDPLKYIVCGKGNELENLQTLCKELNIENKVIFAGYRNDIKELLQIADVFCFPSLREGLSVSLMEAMVAGLPVVGSKIRGNIDLICEDDGGYLLNPHDEVLFQHKIELLIRKQYLREQMGNFNREYIKYFDWKRVNVIMETIYIEAANLLDDYMEKEKRNGTY
ncbi:glycosyltransferase family 4 protein [Caldibacillus lycopersici]|uniref:Glycosyltransferase family 4 protein n=2 Tax=Perspicuibacillus lycopersici TaxID=1325689 RepID=A0AAE3IQ33_9BACI|nr:glycosyltransferase family 4 protein [Perspicuibacillus lycopersici]